MYDFHNDTACLVRSEVNDTRIGLYRALVNLLSSGKGSNVQIPVNSHDAGFYTVVKDGVVLALNRLLQEHFRMCNVNIVAGSHIPLVLPASVYV